MPQLSNMLRPASRSRPAAVLPGAAAPAVPLIAPVPRLPAAVYSLARATAALWLLAITLAMPLPLAAQEPTTAIDQAAMRYRQVRAMCADFEQVIHNRLLRWTKESAGRICQQRPNLLSMRFTDPDGDMVISDGEFVWVYYPSLDKDQVVRQPAAGSPGREDFFREFLDDPGTKYLAEEGGIEAVGGRACRVVTLTPRAGASYRRARLWVDAENHVIRKVEIHETDDVVKTLTLHNVDLSSVPDPALFVFEVPEGARVMGRRGPGPRPRAASHHDAPPSPVRHRTHPGAAG